MRKGSAAVVAESPMAVRTVEPISFPDALRLVIQGKRITRRSWLNPLTYIYLGRGVLMIHLNGPHGADVDHSLIISEADLVAQDWIEAFNA